MIQKIGATVLFSLSLLLFFANPGFTGQDAVQNEADSALKLLKDEISLTSTLLPERLPLLKATQ